MRISILCLTLALFVGCADGTVPPPSAAHPASPNAAEGATSPPPPSTPPSNTGASSASAVDHSGHAGHGAPAAETVTYTCPMHPEVTSDKPGQCPKCGMNLVPKKKDAP